jgi:hypothetical protein
MMIFYWHAPIIPDHIDGVLFNLARGKVPGAWIADIRFVYLLGVNKKLSVTKFNPFALQSDHTL